MNEILRVNKMNEFFSRRLAGLFPALYRETKHDHFKDFGFPEEVTFDHAYSMWRRNALARAAISKTIGKVWVEFPWLLEHERDGSQGAGRNEETSLERAIRQRFQELRVWQQLAEADERSMVGAYSAVILRVADGKKFEEPLERVSGGLDALLEVIPAWEGQLKVVKWNEDETSPEYGQPILWEYDENLVTNNDTNVKKRKVTIHNSRISVWSKDGTLNGFSALEPGYNDLVTIEKIVGAGGEGFWKNAKSAPVLSTQEGADLTKMAKLMGIELKDLLDAMNKQVEDYQKGFDKVLMLQGMTADTMTVNLPQPEQFFQIALQCFAASFNIPLKILVGTQTGERASTEDAREWAIACNSRRQNVVVPAILAFVKKLEACGILRENDDWYVDWDDLTEATVSEKLELSNKMADANTKMRDMGELVFTSEEIREVAGYEPLSDVDKMIDDEGQDGEDESLALPSEDEVEEVEGGEE